VSGTVSDAPNSPHLCLLVMQAGSADLADCATPLLHALTANAMEADVEMYFAGPCVRLLADDTADKVLARETRKPLSALLDDAKASGVRIFVCTSAWKVHVESTATLAQQSTGYAGAATYLGRALQAHWRVLTY
jgi:predicted peroxiredoxin